MATGDITSVTVRSDGWSADVVIEGFATGATYDFGTAGDTSTSKFYLTVVSEGYDATGTLSTISRTVYGTKAVRKPYPNDADLDETGGGNLTVRVALSEYVYVDDNTGAGKSGTAPIATIAAGWCTNTGGSSETSAAYTAGAVTNSSTQDYFNVFGSWDWIAGQPHRTRVKSAFKLAFNGRAGHGVACVKFTVTGGTSSHSETATVTAQTAHERTATGLYVCAFQTPDIPLTSFTQGETLTCRAQVYPKVGDADNVLDTNGRTTLANEILGYNELVLICDKNDALDVIRYVSTSGNDTTGDGSSGNPWATIGKATATAGVNVIRLLGTSTDYNIGVGGTRRTTSEWVIVEPDSSASDVDVFVTTTKSYKTERLCFRNLTVKLTTSGSWLDGENASNCLWFDGCTFDHNGNSTPTTGPGYQSHACYFTNCDGDLSRTKWHLSNFSTSRVAYSYDGVAFGADGTTQTATIGHRYTACSGVNNLVSSPSTSNAAPQPTGWLIESNSLLNTTHASSQLVNVTNKDGVSLQNNLFEKTAGANAQVHIAADTTAAAVTNVIVAHNTIVGSGTGARANCFYNDTGSTPYYHTAFVVANHSLDWNIKTDTFGTANGARIGNWPQLYGVNFADNNFDTQTFAGEYHGPRFTTGSPTFTDSANDDYQPTTADTVLYRTAQTPALLPYDLFGVARSATYNRGAIENLSLASRLLLLRRRIAAGGLA